MFKKYKKEVDDFLETYEPVINANPSRKKARTAMNNRLAMAGFSAEIAAKVRAKEARTARRDAAGDASFAA
jgi:hypothetical protein